MIEIQRITKNQLWEELDNDLITVVLFGGSRLTCVDEVLAAYENGAFAGAVTLSPSGEMNDGPAIIGLLVLERWRRNGIGTKLMESAITRMNERGLTPVHIDVLSKNLKRLLEKLDTKFKVNLIVNDNSEYGDCFDMLELTRGFKGQRSPLPRGRG